MRRGQPTPEKGQPKTIHKLFSMARTLHLLEAGTQEGPLPGHQHSQEHELLQQVAGGSLQERKKEWKKGGRRGKKATAQQQQQQQQL
jgi:hypothetical protein